MIPATLDPSQFSGDVWVTADLHLGHKNILEKTDRPWTNIDKHDNALIKYACEVVKPNDLYIIIGDLAMAGEDSHRKVMRYISKLPGIKILVFGNHDEFKPHWYVNAGFALAATAIVLPGGVLIVHDPSAAEIWPKDKPVICGHLHSFFDVKYNVVNVGVDVGGGYPFKLEEALAKCTETRPTLDWQKIARERHLRWAKEGE